jgi:hypothetical protein
MGSTCTNGIKNRDKKWKGNLGFGKEDKCYYKIYTRTIRLASNYESYH